MSNNAVARAISATGWIVIISGLISSIVIFRKFSDYLPEPYLSMYGLSALFGGLIFGLLIVGFGRILSSLTEISAKLSADKRVTPNPRGTSEWSPQRRDASPDTSSQWFIYCGRRVEVSSLDKSATVDGQKFTSTEEAKAWLEQKYPGQV